jgi:hypothetical protein
MEYSFGLYSNHGCFQYWSLVVVESLGSLSFLAMRAFRKVSLEKLRWPLVYGSNRQGAKSTLCCCTLHFISRWVETLSPSIQARQQVDGTPFKKQPFQHPPPHRPNFIWGENFFFSLTGSTQYLSTFFVWKLENLIFFTRMSARPFEYE